MFVAMSRFVVANRMEEEAHKAFRARPHLVDEAPGFIKMDVLRPVENPAEFWLLTYWEAERHYREWHKGHTYRDSHAGIPKGLKLVKRSAEIRFLEHVTD